MIARVPALALALIFVSPHCGGSGTQVEFYSVEGHAFSWWERQVVRGIASEAVADVRKLLPDLPKALTIRVQDDSHMGEESGESAFAMQPHSVLWTVDPAHSGGVAAIARAHLRSTLFHELHHLVRDAAVPRTSILDRAVGEGLATAFARDFTGATQPWCQYPGDAARWVDEIARLPASEPRDPWTSQHPDGRRWVAFKAGTYLVDRAMRATGESSAELACTPTHSILQLGL